jgi:hypothetical protein
MPARARPGPAYFSLTNLCTNLVAAGVNLRTADLSTFPHGCLCRFRFRCSFASHDATPTDWIAGEGLEPAHF